MKFTHAVAAIAACTLMSGAALADQQGKNRARSGSGAVGVSASGPEGSVAGGGAVSAAQQNMNKQGRKMRQRHSRGGQEGDQQAMSTTQRCVPSSAATQSANTAYADRDTANAGSTTAGTAQGSGDVTSSSDGGAFASRTRESSDADSYGTSTATATRSRRC